MSNLFIAKAKEICTLRPGCNRPSSGCTFLNRNSRAVMVRDPPALKIHPLLQNQCAAFLHPLFLHYLQGIPVFLLFHVTERVPDSLEVTETICSASGAARESMSHSSTSFQNSICPELGCSQHFPVLKSTLPVPLYSESYATCGSHSGLLLSV